MTTNDASTFENLIVTIKDFYPPKMPPSGEAIQSTNLAAFNQKIKKPNPQVFSQFLGIDNILQQNRSDGEKLDEIMHKLNETGALTKVNVFNISTSTMKIRRKTTPMPLSTLRSKNVTYIRPYEQNDHQKDSKELKVQFVLDCDLKDSMNSESNVRKPVYQQSQATQYISPVPVVKKHPIQYPNFDAVFNQRFPIKNSNQLFYYQPTRVPNTVPKKPTKKIVNKVTTEKTRVKNVYVDPPAVAAISNAFENVYNYFEEALTTNVVQKKPREKKRAVKQKKIRATGQGRIPIRKRSTVSDRIAATTNKPEYRYTKSQTTGANQKLTTQIHVTSEYLGKEPEIAEKPTDSESDESDSVDYGSEEEYDDEREDEDEDDYDDGGEDDDGDYDFAFPFGGVNN